MEFNATVVKCLGFIRQAVKCRQFERPAAAAATDGIGGNKAAIAAIIKEFNDIISSVKDVWEEYRFSPLSNGVSVSTSALNF